MICACVTTGDPILLFLASYLSLQVPFLVIERHCRKHVYIFKLALIVWFAEAQILDRGGYPDKKI